MNSTWLKSFAGGLKSNFKGQSRLKDKLIIIESDDWGAIRTPSRESLKAFAQAGFELDKSLYKVDALASQSDLQDLIELLLSFKNAFGESPVITANAIMANPDFDKIRASDFQSYYYEPFTNTFKNYPEHQSNLELWKQGMEQKVFYPQFHGREHLNMNRWLKALQSGNEKLRLSYDWRCTYSGMKDYAFMEAYDWSMKEEIKEHQNIISDGLRIFEDTFGYKSRSFIAPCYNWDSELEPFLADKDIKCIQGIGSQLAPTGTFNHYNAIPHFFGQQNIYGSFYNVRNVFFEPVNNPNIDWSIPALARIQAAFLMKRPAVISTHRINYVGYIDPKNKESGLRQLGKLLKHIIKKWPDVRFITTDQLIDYIAHGKS